RWPFRRRGTEPVPAPAASPGEPTAAPARRPSRDWALLPPIPVTVARSAPLVIGPAPVLPPLPGRRPPAPIVPPAGRAEGIAAEPEESGPIMIQPPSYIPADVMSSVPPPVLPAEPPSTPVALPPPVQEMPRTRGVEQPPTVLQRRRPNLGESRRLGLGAPTSRP